MQTSIPADPLAIHLTPDYPNDIAKDGVWIDAVGIQGMARMLKRIIIIINNEADCDRFKNGFG